MDDRTGTPRTGLLAGGALLAYRSPAQVPLPGWPVAVRSAGQAAVGDRFADRRRRRDVLMVLWSLAGRGVYRNDDRDHPLPAGSWLWIPPGTRYDLFAVSRRWELRWLTIDGPAVAAWSAGWSPPALPCRPCRPLETAAHDGLLAAVVDPAPERLQASLALATSLLVAGLHPRRSDDLVDRALALIEERHADPLLDVAALARALGCHRSHLARCCTARTGAGPKELLTQRRIRHAQELLLAHRALPITAVAARVGFGGADQLARAFQRLCRITPTAWRRQGGGIW